jgi:hypothetical protein
MAPWTTPPAVAESTSGAVAALPAALTNPCPNLPPCRWLIVPPARPWLAVFTAKPAPDSSDPRKLPFAHSPPPASNGPALSRSQSSRAAQPAGVGNASSSFPCSHPTEVRVLHSQLEPKASNPWSCPTPIQKTRPDPVLSFECVVSKLLATGLSALRWRGQATDLSRHV